MKKIFALAVLALVLSGCVSTPGSVSTSQSKFDGTTEVNIEPGWLAQGLMGSSIKLGGFWNDKMGNDFVMVAFYTGTDSIKGLKFNIDGEFVTLQPAEKYTDFSYSIGSGYAVSWSSKRFACDLDFIRKITEAKKVIVKLELSRTFAEGDFKSGPTLAKGGFQKGLARIAAFSASK